MRFGCRAFVGLSYLSVYLCVSVFLFECVNVCALSIMCMRVCDISLNDTVLGFRDFFCV